MKTVIDAVNQFKGNSRVGNYYYVCNQDSGVVALWGKATLDDLYGPLWSELCTDREFNDLVSQMETNFGKCEQTYGNYKGLYRACKRLELYPLINNKPQPTPIFTQEMTDNGVLPVVGMEVLYTCINHQSGKPVIEVGKWYSGTVIAYHDGFVWTSDNGLRQLSNTKFKPLTPPITLINGAAYQFYVEETASIFHGIWSKERQQMCTEHSYFYKRVCEGIQPLTVEVK